MEGSTLSVLRARSEKREKTQSQQAQKAYLVSIGGYGDDDELLGGYCLPIQITGTEREKLPKSGRAVQVSAAGTDAECPKWVSFSAENIVILSINGQCVLCDSKDSLAERSADYLRGESAASKVFRVEGHTSVTVNDIASSHLQCACSVSDAVKRHLSRRVLIDCSEIENITVNPSETIVLFGGLNEDYETNNDIHFLRVVSFEIFLPTSDRYHRETLLLADLFVPQHGKRPPPIYRHCATVQKGKMYVFGGDVSESVFTGEYAFQIGNGFYRFDLESLEWETLPSPWDVFRGNSADSISTLEKARSLPMTRTFHNHALATLSPVDENCLVLLGGYDFTATAALSEDHLSERSVGWLTAAYSRFRSAWRRLILRWTACDNSKRLPYCALFDTRVRRWSAVFCDESYDCIPPTAINGHVAFGGRHSSGYWCGGKGNASSESSLELVEDSAEMQPNRESEEIDSAFTGDQEGEFHCLSITHTNTLSLKSVLLWPFGRLTDQVVMRYSVTRNCEKRKKNRAEVIPRSIYMPGGCVLESVVETRTGTASLEALQAAKDARLSIAFMMGGNRRHPDADIRTLCWLRVVS